MVRFEIKRGDSCPLCKTGTIIVREGKFGDFFSCTTFPRCAFTQPIKVKDSELDLAADAFLLAHGIKMPRI